MTRISLAALACSAFIIFASSASSQDTPKPALHVSAGNFNIAADNVLRTDPPRTGPNPYASEVQAKGHVEIRTCCVQRPVTRENPHPPKSYLIVHADEAEYHAATGTLELRGVVKMNFQAQSPR